MVYNTEGRISSEYLNTIYDEKTILGSKGSNRAVKDILICNLYDIMTRLDQRAQIGP